MAQLSRQSDLYPRRNSAESRGRSVAPADGVVMVGNSPLIRRLRSIASLVAPTDATLLLNGPTGTGKEVLARFIHANSTRANRPFIAVNCAALPDSLVESELFGHEKGAFTGATAARIGCFEAAEGGTLLLDEITEVGTHVQAKLLRAIQEREIRRVGGNTTRKVNVRIIAASSRDLLNSLRTGVLREDLYYRLRMVEMVLPPLRERKQDLPILCKHFLEKYGERYGSPLRYMSLDALSLLEAYHWPGNVRELENVLGRASVLATSGTGDTLFPSHLPGDIRGEPDIGWADTMEGSLSLREAILRVKRHLVAEALRRTAGNKREAACLLGISRRGFYNLLEETEL